MRRGTTPTFTLTIPDSYDLTECNNVYATFAQGKTVITKSGDDIVVEPHSVDVYLDQEETLAFTTGNIKVQLNFTFAGGQRACTDIVPVSIGENLVNEVLE